MKLALPVGWPVRLRKCGCSWSCWNNLPLESYIKTIQPCFGAKEPRQSHEVSQSSSKYSAVWRENLLHVLCSQDVQQGVYAAPPGVWDLPISVSSSTGFVGLVTWVAVTQAWGRAQHRQQPLNLIALASISQNPGITSTEAPQPSRHHLLHSNSQVTSPLGRLIT